MMRGPIKFSQEVGPNRCGPGRVRPRRFRSDSLWTAGVKKFVRRPAWMAVAHGGCTTSSGNTEKPGLSGIPRDFHSSWSEAGEHNRFERESQ